MAMKVSGVISLNMIAAQQISIQLAVLIKILLRNFCTGIMKKDLRQRMTYYKQLHQQN